MRNKEGEGRNDESLCLSIKDIETMLAFFALNKKWELMDSKVQARARKDGTSKVKMEFVIRPLDDLKTPDQEPEMPWCPSAHSFD